MSGYQSVVTRRQTLQWLLTTLSLTTLPRTPFAFADGPETSGYGQDPPVGSYSAPWPRLLSGAELHQLAILGDMIIPGAGDTPPPSRLGIQDFLDEWVSAPYPQQRRDRDVIRGGLVHLNEESLRLSGLDWTQGSEATRYSILNDLAAGKNQSEGTSRLFFCRVRQLVVSAYYTTAQGLRAVGYVGNIAMVTYPAVAGELEAELMPRIKKLGL